MRTVRDEYFLTIGQICEEYRRNGVDPEQVRQALLNAFWRGCFERFVRENGRSQFPLISRRSMLKAWVSIAEHPGLFFATLSEDGSEVLQDGSYNVNGRLRMNCQLIPQTGNRIISGTLSVSLRPSASPTLDAMPTPV